MDIKTLIEILHSPIGSFAGALAAGSAFATLLGFTHYMVTCVISPEPLEKTHEENGHQDRFW